MQNLKENLRKFSGIKILVIGDVMLDRYQWGSVSRISPEAPVPIVALEKTSVIAGGAANVAANIAGLGARPILFGIIGDDEDAKTFPVVLEKASVKDYFLFPIKNRQTTVKTRIIAHNQQIVRIDQETTSPLLREDAVEIIKHVEKVFDEVKIVILSDYAKGLLTNELLSQLIELGSKKGKIIAVDPKGKDYTKYKGATILTPNRQEAADACNLEDNSQNLIEKSAKLLLENLALKGLLITQGENGMTLLEKDKNIVHLKATARKVYDVTGAGDTVIASLATCLAIGLGFEESAEFANLAAGFVVEQIGTTAIDKEIIQNSLK